MNGKYIKLVEQTIQLTEEREQIKSAIVNILDGIAQDPSKSFGGLGFWKKFKETDPQKGGQLSPIFYLSKGQFKADPKILNSMKGESSQDMAVNYESEESISAFINEIVEEVKARIEKFVIFSDQKYQKQQKVQNVDPKEVEELKKAILREIFLTVFANVTIGSQKVDSKAVEMIIVKAIA